MILRALVLLLLALLLPGRAALAALHPPGDVLTLTQARLVTASGESQVGLPHVLSAQDFSAGRQLVTYALTLDLAQAPSEALGLYIAKVSLSGRVRLNGVELGSCGPGPLSHLRCLHQPLWLLAAQPLWVAGTNVIEVDVWATDGQLNGLSPVVVGPAQTTFESFYRPERLLKYDLVVALLWMALTLGLISLLLAFNLRDQPVYLWFGLACVLRSLNSLNPLIHNLSADLFWSSWFLVSSRLVALPFSILAVVAFFDRSITRLTPWLVGYACVVPVLVAASGNNIRFAIAMALPILAGALVGTAYCMRWYLQSRRTRDLMLLLTIGVLVLAGLHDIWRLLNTDGFMRPLILPYTNAAVLIVMGGIIIHRATQALRTTANLSRILGERVAATEAELQEQHQTILQLERMQARTQERERLMRDLHDGLGSALSSARMRLDDEQLQPGQMRVLLDECVDDMRLLLDTSAPDGELIDSLGELRYRMDRRLAGSPLAIEWRISLDGMPAIPPTTRLQLMRIVQESLSNALRHSGATRLTVSALYHPEQRHLSLQVSDNGQGFSQAPGARRGRGLTNMHHRAGQLGAQFEVRTGAQGTTVTLNWHLPTENRR